MKGHGAHMNRTMHHVCIESFGRRWIQGFEVGLKLGTEIGGFNQIARTQATLNRILFKEGLESS